MSMNEVGIRLKMETGEFVAGADQAKQALDSLENALQKAAVAGDSKGVVDYATALNKYKKYAGFDEDEVKQQQKPSTAMTVVENATKIISRAPNYIGAMGSGNSAGAALGMASDAASGAKALGLTAGLGTGAMVGLGIGATLVGLGVAANKLSEQWEKQIPQAMELTAVLGNLTGNYRTNSEAFSRAFNLAGEAATKFGYTVEEGMSVMGQLAKYGVSGKGLDAYNATSRVLQYSRGTGADRESLMRVEGYAARYGLGSNSLGYAYGGSRGQGLENAQFQEYLNSMLRIFEDGLSRGVVKGFDEITRTQNFIAMLGNGSPLWKGEQGLQRYETMNQSQKSTSLQEEYDVIRYKAVENVMREAAAHGFRDESKTGGTNWKAYEKYGDINKEGYLVVQRAREGGLTPEIFEETMRLLKSEVAAGSYHDLTEAVKKTWNLSYMDTAQVIAAYEGKQYKNAVAQIANPASAVSPEMSLATATEQIKIALANAGQSVLPGKLEIMSVLRGILNGITGNKIAEGYRNELEPALQGIYGSRSDEFVRGKAEALLKSALKDTSAKAGRDTDQNGINDNAEAAMSIIGYLEDLPEDVRRYLDASGTLDSIWQGKNVNDLPKIAEYITSGKYKTKEFDQGLKGFTGKTVPFTDVETLIGKFGKYAPDWEKTFPNIDDFRSAAIDNKPGAVNLYREITTRLNGLESSWDKKISDATTAAMADKKITKEEQKTIDSLTTGKNKEIAGLIASILGPLNTLIGTAEHTGTEGENGGTEITPKEWEKMWQRIMPGVGTSNLATQSNFQLSSLKQPETEKTIVNFDMAGSMIASAFMDKLKGWVPSSKPEPGKPVETGKTLANFQLSSLKQPETEKTETVGSIGINDDLANYYSKRAELFFAGIGNHRPDSQPSGKNSLIQNAGYHSNPSATTKDSEGLNQNPWTFGRQFVDAFQHATPEYDNGGISTSDWAGLFGKLVQALADFSARNGDAATKMVEAAAKMSEPTEFVFASAGQSLAGAGRA